MQPDNWGSLARIGLFIVSREVVPVLCGAALKNRQRDE
mgnify:CR=1 FL=1